METVHVINAAIIGLGWWGRHIVQTLNGKSGKIRFVRAVDVDLNASGDFAAQNELVLSDNMLDAVHDETVDAVVLATPHSLHEEQILAAAAAGKHVFCEKPLALTKASAEKVVQACEDNGLVLGVGHERRFEPAWIEIKRMVEAGELGSIMHVESNFSHDKFVGMPLDNWRSSEKEAPAAGMTATAIHLTDAYLNMFGPIEEVHAITAQRKFATPTGDVISIQVKFENGATGSIASILATPFFSRFQVFGSQGWVEARDSSHPSETGVTDLTVCFEEGKVETRTIESHDTVRLNFDAFADAVAGNRAYPYTADEKVQNIAIFEAVCRSVISGAPEKI